MKKTSFCWHNFEELAEHTSSLIASWKADNYTPKTWFFSGDLGAGKSTLIRSIIQTMSNTDHVPSPTYSLMELYQTPVGQVAHFDLYRLDSDQDFLRYGLQEYAEDVQTMCFVEWPEKISPGIKSLFGAQAIHIHLSLNADHTKRTATIHQT